MNNLLQEIVSQGFAIHIDDRGYKYFKPSDSHILADIYPNFSDLEKHWREKKRSKEALELSRSLNHAASYLYGSYQIRFFDDGSGEIESLQGKHHGFENFSEAAHKLIELKSNRNKDYT